MPIPLISQIGASPHRREDDRLLRGAGQYADDNKLARPHYVGFVRSQFAPAVIEHIALDGALACAGGKAVHTGADLRELGTLWVNPVTPLHADMPFPCWWTKQSLLSGNPLWRFSPTAQRRP